MPVPINAAIAAKYESGVVLLSDKKATLLALMLVDIEGAKVSVKSVDFLMGVLGQEKLSFKQRLWVNSVILQNAPHFWVPLTHMQLTD